MPKRTINHPQYRPPVEHRPEHHFAVLVARHEARQLFKAYLQRETEIKAAAERAAQARQHGVAAEALETAMLNPGRAHALSLNPSGDVLVGSSLEGSTDREGRIKRRQALETVPHYCADIPTLREIERYQQERKEICLELFRGRPKSELAARYNRTKEEIDQLYLETFPPKDANK